MAIVKSEVLLRGDLPLSLKEIVSVTTIMLPIVCPYTLPNASYAYSNYQCITLQVP